VIINFLICLFQINNRRPHLLLDFVDRNMSLILSYKSIVFTAITEQRDEDNYLDCKSELAEELYM